MKKTPSRVAAQLGCCLLTATGLVAAPRASARPAAAVPHGGQYRGPIPDPAGPLTPGPGTVDPGGRATTGLRGGTDLTRWQLWWEFNKDVYLRRRPSGGGDGGDGAGGGVPVDDAQRRDLILPALVKALKSTPNRDVTSSCMVALAKIGFDHPDHAILPLLRAQLRSGDQEIRETAALALGISQRVDAIPDLVALLSDARAGRALMDREHVDDRTRAFAAHGLGLIARDATDVAVKERVLSALTAVLDNPREDNRDVLVGALCGLRLLNPSPELGSRGKRLAWQVLAALERYGAAEVGPGRQIIQAHVAPALARVLGRGTSIEHERVKRACAELLLARSGTNHALSQSAALALGQLALPAEAEPNDAVYSTALLRAVAKASDLQVRFFSMIALGQIGGAANLKALAGLLRTEKGPAQAWAALALGLLAHHAPLAPGQQQSAGDVAGPLLLRELDGTRNPDLRGALAIALGLARHKAAAPRLRQLVKDHRRDEELCGYFCIGLALMEDAEAVPLLEHILTDARRRPLLMAQAATALARLQQRGATALLHPMLRRADHSTITLAAAATALGTIGDAGSVEPLVAVLGDEALPKLLRAFAAAALGSIADGDELPWNALIAKDLNYRALVETLSNGASGVLDIL